MKPTAVPPCALWPAAWLALLVAAAPAARAALPFRASAVSVTSENDKYFAGSDRHYTNGLRISFLGETTLHESPEFVQAVARWIPTLRGAAGDGRLLAEHERYKVGLALGHNIYTPQDIATTAPQPDDRPYAGWLYAAFTFQAQNAAGTTLRSVELALGVVGPSAFGEEVQNNFHQLIGVDEAQGWEHQLHDEPALLLTWERRHRLGGIELLDPQFKADAIARGGVSLGNVALQASLGLTVRAGWRLPADFGPDLIRPAGDNSAIADEAPPRASVYLFASGEARGVAHNLFLDGNTWRDSPSVESRPLVADFAAGLVTRVPVGRRSALQLAYTQNYRTKEFYGQERRDVFGSLSASLLF